MEEAGPESNWRLGFSEVCSPHGGRQSSQATATNLVSVAVHVCRMVIGGCHQDLYVRRRTLMLPLCVSQGDSWTEMLANGYQSTIDHLDSGTPPVCSSHCCRTGIGFTGDCRDAVLCSGRLAA